MKPKPIETLSESNLTLDLKSVFVSKKSFFILILVGTALTQNMLTKEKEVKEIKSCLFIDKESALRDRSRQRNFQQSIENQSLDSSAHFSCSASSSDLKG